jgi:microcystin-dependent protein
MSQPFVGQVIAVGFNFAPTNWALCDGSLLPISQYTALFQLLGTTFGGDGRTTFGLPDLRGRAALGAGQGPGLQPYVQGELAGAESVTLAGGQFASHTHGLSGAATATTAAPGSAVVLGTPGATTPIYAATGASAALAGGAVSLAPGGGGPHENRQPTATINYIISLSGVFPSQG